MATKSSKAPAGKAPLQLLSSCIEGGRAFLFFASDELGLVAVSPGFVPGDSPAIQGREGWTWVFGPGATPEQQQALPGQAALQLDKVAGALQGRLAKRLEVGSFVVAPLPGPLPSRFLFNPGEQTSWTLTLPATGRNLVVGLAAAGELDFSYMDYSVRFQVEGEPLSQAESGQAAQFFFVSVARFLLGVGPERTADSLTPNAPPPEHQGDPGFSISLNLANEVPAETLAQLASLSAREALVHLELPSVCTNSCVFCQKAYDQTPSSDVSAQTVLERAGSLFEALNQASSLERVDLSLGGQDCLESPALLPTLDLARTLTRLDQINLVTPGTRLGEPGMVESLIKAGVHRVSLSLLGPDEARHDALAGRPGAFLQLRAAVESLEREGMAFDLATVVVVQSLPHLVETVELAFQMAGPVSLYYYLADPTVPQARTTLLMPRLDQFREILANNQPRLEGKLRSIEHVPLCALPPWARHLAGTGYRTHPDSVSSTLPVCANCPAYGSLCPSVTSVYFALHGDAGLQTLTAQDVEMARKPRK